jgi:tetratricopeptide (TPR) repeat protein
VAATLLAYLDSFAGTFQFDDWNVVVDEPAVASLAAWWRSMPGIRPLLKLTFAVEAQAGLGLQGRHAVNLALHVGAALLALALLRRLEALFTHGDEGTAGRAALLGALLFALHPVQTEAVTYLSGRSSSLAALLALASVLAWLDGRARGRPWLVHGASPLLLLLSLGAKETAALLPLALLLLAAAAPRAPGGWRRALRDVAAHGLVLALAAGASLAAPAYRAMLDHARGLRPPLGNLRVQLDGLAWLVGQVLWPARLLADPGPPDLSGPWWPAALTALLLVALTAAALGALRLRMARSASLGAGATPGREAAALALLWWLVWLPPSGWLLPRPEAANDRQAYLALLGPAWLLGRWLVHRGPALARPGPTAGWARPVAAWLLPAALCLGLGVATARRNLVYADEVTFWTDVARQAPRNPRAFNNLGLALSARCRLEEAEAAFQEALAVDPDHARARVNLWLLRQGDPPGDRRGQGPTCPVPVGDAMDPGDEARPAQPPRR